MMVKGLKQGHIHALLEIIKWNRASYMEKAMKYLYPASGHGRTRCRECGQMPERDDICPSETKNLMLTSPKGEGVDVAYRDGVYKKQLEEFDELEGILLKVKK